MTSKLMKQEYQQSRLKSSFRKFYESIQWPCQQIQFIIESNADWRFSYQLLVHYLYTELTTDFFRYFLIMTTSTRRVWPVGRGCSLLHGTWSHLWCFGGPCLLCSYFVYLFNGRWDWILFVISISFIYTLFWVVKFNIRY